MADDVRSLYVTALQNTHGIELKALQIMERQHISETHGQRDCLEDALTSLSMKPSTLKEGYLGLVGSLMALGLTPAQDDILKDAFADLTFENEEERLAKRWPPSSNRQPKVSGANPGRQ